MFKLVKSALFAAALGASSVASAAVLYTDTVTAFSGGGYLSIGQSISWLHDITDSGYAPGAPIESVTLSVLLTDDQSDCVRVFGANLCQPAESGVVNPDGFFNVMLFAQTSGSTTVSTTQGPFAQITTALQNDGKLGVTVTSLVGDFYVSRSDLSATSVPVPGVLALLGIGLVGVGAASRGRRVS